MSRAAPGLSLIIPTRNERRNIRPLLRAIDRALAGAVSYEVLFVDDSNDTTPALLEQIHGERPDVDYIHREGGSGLASAVVLGFGRAAAPVLAVMDADLQHPPELLPLLYREVAAGADLVLPSRFLAGGSEEGLAGPLRELASGSAKYAGQLLLPSLRGISDPTGGYFMLRREVVEGKALNPTGWKILMEVLVMGSYRRVVEVPYTFAKRGAGDSKMSLKVTLQYFAHIFSLLGRGERERRFYRPLLAGLGVTAADMTLFALVSHLLPIPLWTAAAASGLGALLCVLLPVGIQSGDAPTPVRATALCGVAALALKVLTAAALTLPGALAPWLCNGAGLAMAGLFLHRLARRSPGESPNCAIRYERRGQP